MSVDVSPAQRLERRLRRASAEGRTALVPYLMAGFPDPGGFQDLVRAVARRADVLELGLPFSDPTADGPVIAAAGRVALARGVNFRWVCALAARIAPELDCGLVLMSYLNPLLAVGLAEAVARLVDAGFEGLIVPDLPLEESDELREACDARGLALVQLVTPLTPPARARRIAAASRGFLYAVTRTGTTGAAVEVGPIQGTLDDLGAHSPVPVCAGFGLRAPEQVRALHGHCHGAVVGSALIDLLARGEDPLPLLDSLRAAADPAATTTP